MESVSSRTLVCHAVALAVGVGIGLGASVAGCNSYDLLIHDHFAQASFSNKVDILWLVDSSNSMHQDQENLKLSFGQFINQLAEPTTGEEGDQDLTLDTLSDAVLVYQEFLGNRTQFLNYQMGITTTQSRPCEHDPTSFADCEDSKGNTGRLRGLGNTGNNTSSPPTFLKPDTETLIPDFQSLVDVGIYGATEEYGLWVTAQVVCDSLEMPADSDFLGWEEEAALGGTVYNECHGENWNENHPWYEFCRCMPQEFYDYNIDNTGERFLRDDSTLVVIVVTDEGDFTPMLGATDWPWDIDDCDLSRSGSPWPTDLQDVCEGNPAVLCENYCKLDRFLQFFEALDRRVVYAVIGPGAELVTDQQGNRGVEIFCNDQNSTTAMIEFYLWAAELTYGMYQPINVRDDNFECVDANFDEALDELGRLVSNLASGWPLSKVPDVNTVLVFVDGVEVPPAGCLPDDTDCVPSSYHPSCLDQPSSGLNGWTYDELGQAVRMHGDCLPDYNQVVDVLYLPESGAGRPLPF